MRGRHKLAFRTDPDRFVLALAIVFREFGASRRGAVEIAVAYLSGKPVAIRKPDWGRGLGMLPIAYELPGYSGPNAIANRARHLRRKVREALADPEDLRWLAIASRAWHCALGRGAPLKIQHWAALIGEQAFARQVWLPLAACPMEPGLKRFLRREFSPPDSELLTRL
jgi:hypothetical protein